MAPSLHPIDVENYDATPDIILIASDDDEDYDIEEYDAAPHDNSRWKTSQPPLSLSAGIIVALNCLCSWNLY
nr:hypothetical protein [Tanacetum cinerariifolium]